jgi:hypothetical protein
LFFIGYYIHTTDCIMKQAPHSLPIASHYPTW